MDTETIRQVMPALIALSGALFGAAVGAGIQWWNTRATIAAGEPASREQAERVRQQEHAMWLLNHKAEGLRKVHRRRDGTDAQCKWLVRGDARTTKTAALVFEVRPTLLRLVAPDEIRKLEDKVYGDCMRLAVALFAKENVPHADKGWTNLCRHTAAVRTPAG